MKEKIHEALKKSYSNYGLSKEALDAVASLLEKSITKEEEIENSIKESFVENLLKVYQKDVDTQRTAKSKAEKDLADYKVKYPEKEPEKDDNNDEPKEDPIVKQLTEKVTAMEKQLADANKSRLVSEISNRVGELMKDKGCTNDAVRQIILSKVQIAEDATIESATSIAENSINEYNSLYKTLYGDSPIPQQGGGYNPQEYKPGMFSGAIKMMENAGILPQEKNK